MPYLYHGFPNSGARTAAPIRAFMSEASLRGTCALDGETLADVSSTHSSNFLSTLLAQVSMLGLNLFSGVASAGLLGRLAHSFVHFNFHIPANAARFAVCLAIATCKVPHVSREGHASAGRPENRL